MRLHWVVCSFVIYALAGTAVAQVPIQLQMEPLKSAGWLVSYDRALFPLDREGKTTDMLVGAIAPDRSAAIAILYSTTRYPVPLTTIDVLPPPELISRLGVPSSGVSGAYVPGFVRRWGLDAIQWTIVGMGDGVTFKPDKPSSVKTFSLRTIESFMLTGEGQRTPVVLTGLLRCAVSRKDEFIPLFDALMRSIAPERTGLKLVSAEAAKSTPPGGSSEKSADVPQPPPERTADPDLDRASAIVLDLNGGTDVPLEDLTWLSDRFEGTAFGQLADDAIRRARYHSEAAVWMRAVRDAKDEELRQLVAITLASSVAIRDDVMLALVAGTASERHVHLTDLATSDRDRILSAITRSNASQQRLMTGPLFDIADASTSTAVLESLRRVAYPVKSLSERFGKRRFEPPVLPGEYLAQVGSTLVAAETTDGTTATVSELKSLAEVGRLMERDSKAAPMDHRYPRRSP